MKKVVAFAVLACLLSMTLGVALTHASESTPQLPHAFYGTVAMGSALAPVGTSVEARGEGVETGIAGNPIIISEAGKYGGPGALDAKLVVQGDIADGTLITFFVSGNVANQTAEWHSGAITQLDLTATLPAPSPAQTIEVNFFGGTTAITVDSNGVVQETVELTSPTGDLTITIPVGTMALCEDEPLTELTAETSTTPPPPPEDTNVIGLAYDFGPDCATFDPPITLTFTYDPDSLPEGVSEEDLVIAYYDTVTGEWVSLVCVVDAENNTVTALVGHFTIFTLIATLPPPVEEEPPVVVEEEEPVVEEEEPTVVEEEEPVVEEEEPTVVEEEEPVVVEEEELPEAAGVNWPVVGGIIGGVVVVAGLIGFLWYRRRAYS